MFLQHVRTGWAPATLRRLGAALEKVRREDAALGLPALAGRSAEEAERARRLASEAARRNIEWGYGEAGQACCRELLEPLKRRLGGLVRSERAGLRAEAAADAWAAEAAAVLAECRRTAGEWRAWWTGRARELVVGEERGKGRAAFRVVERFPRYVEAVVESAVAAAAVAAAEVEARVGEAVARFYDDGSPWARFTMDLGAAPATVGVRREGEQLVDQVVLAFLWGGRTVREGIAAAAEGAAGRVGDWAEACGEARERLAERIGRMEAAKAGVLGVLGAASAEEVLAVTEVL
jgi:hypothetical protein